MLDIPLLYEVGADKLVDAVVVVSAAPHVQRSRVLERPGMTVEKFEALLVKQMPDAEKRRRADFIVDSGQGIEPAREQVRDILRKVATMANEALIRAEAACAKSSSIPKPRDLIRCRGTVWSRSAASNC